MSKAVTETSEPSGEVLARLLLIQSIAGQLPNQTSIVAFVCRGLERVPGVKKATNEPPGAPSGSLAPSTERCSLHRSNRYGDILIQLSDVQEYEVYRPHVHNLLFVIGVILEEYRQRRITVAQQQELEKRVRDRTEQLYQEVQERRAAEFELAKEKEQLDVTLRSIGDGVITIDTLGRIVIINPVAEQLTGWSREEALGRPLAQVFVAFDERPTQKRDDPVSRVLGEMRRVEFSEHDHLLSRDGCERAIAGNAAPLRDREGGLIGVVLSFRDITERNRLLEEMQRAERLDAIGVLAGGIAHDFNNLLGGIFGYVCLAREGASDDSELASTLDEALLVFERARDLTQQLLTFAKGGAPVRSFLDLRRLLTDCTRFALSGSNVASMMTLYNDLPNVAADANQIWRVIDNLVRNAVQAMPGGGTITVSADTVVFSRGEHPVLAEGRYVCIMVVDDGPGIPRIILPKIFDPFFTTKEHGTGLGLATAYSIVRKHEGHIDVESNVGAGTTFRIYLPTAASPTAAPAQTKVSAQVCGSGRALVLDDEDYLRHLFTQFLTRMGYHVTAVRSGEEAVAAVEQAEREGRPFRLALLDLTIPGGMGGKEAISLIRPKCPDLIAVASSGYSEDPVMARPGDFGFTASLPKPFAAPQLAELLSSLGEGREASTA